MGRQEAKSSRMKTAALLGAVATALSMVGSPAQAVSEPDGDEPGLVAYTGPLPDGVDLSLGKDMAGQMPEAMSDGIWGLEMAGYGQLVNTYEWDADSETLLIYSADNDTWSKLLSEYLPGQRVEVIPAQHSRAEIDAVMSSIVRSGGALGAGERIVTAIPAKDGSGIEIGIESTSGRASRLSSTRLAAFLGDTSVPLSITQAPEVAPAGRVASYLNTYWLGGTGMSTPGSTSGSFYGCSTGFAIGKLSSSDVGMLSAEHCGRDKPGTDWYYGWTSSTLAGRSLGNFQGTITSIGYTSDTALWTGGNLSKMIPAIYTGDHNDVGTGEFIRGGNYPAVGTDVCYTGSRSGNVCDNEVLYQGVLICYAVTQCYSALTWTSQRNSIEAVGNGDSGGPVYQLVSGKVMASGVISGIVGGSSTCTGEPGVSGGRQCSPVALFAPVGAALGSGSGWGLSYIP